jgi:hypothetical protein
MLRLTLTASDFQGPNRWYWRLRDAGGTLRADQSIELDPNCWQYAAYLDLYGYLSAHVAPDRRVDDQRRILRVPSALYPVAFGSSHTIPSGRHSENACYFAAVGRCRACEARH